MFESRTANSPLQSALNLGEVVYHATVRHLRRTHGNALIGLLLALAQSMMMISVFFVLFQVLGWRAAAIRGDFLLYIMSGIFIFMTHVSTLSAIVASEGPASPMMNHAPMNTVVSISAAALGSLYIQLLSMATILGLYHLIFNAVEIYNPAGAMGMVLLSWFFGVAAGLILLSLKPWAPEVVGFLTQLYSRVNMFASGKMFLANQLPSSIIIYFSWNPLFHIIDQCRGYVFINYEPYHTNSYYPFFISLALIFLGLLGEFYTRKRASVSWDAKR